MRSSSPIRAVAVIEALKGCIALISGAGLLSLLHRDLFDLAVQFLVQAHLNPAAKYPSIFLAAAHNLTDTRLLLLALGAAAYSALRLLESYGLFHNRAWAEALAAGSSAIYVPIELYEVARNPSWISFGFLLLNLLILFIMVRALQLRRTKRLENTA
jgi:uncharacterized membrane protein (DUF2068 family)